VLEKAYLEPIFELFGHGEYLVCKILGKPYTNSTLTKATGNCGSQCCMEELKQHPKEMLFKIEFAMGGRCAGSSRSKLF
jgi:hypothetical protein